MEYTVQYDEPPPMSRFEEGNRCAPRIHGNSFTLTSSKESRTRFYVLGRPNNYLNKRRENAVPPHSAPSSFVINQSDLHTQDQHRHEYLESMPPSAPSFHAKQQPPPKLEKAPLPPPPKPEMGKTSDDKNPMYDHALLLASVSAMAHTEAEALNDKNSAGKASESDHVEEGSSELGKVKFSDSCKTPENSPPRKKNAQKVSPSPSSPSDDSPKTPKNAELSGLFNAAYERNEKSSFVWDTHVEGGAVIKMNLPHSIPRGHQRSSPVEEQRGMVTPIYQEHDTITDQMFHSSPGPYGKTYRRPPVFSRENQGGPPYGRSRYYIPMKESPQWTRARDDNRHFLDSRSCEFPDFHETNRCPEQPILTSRYESRERSSSEAGRRSPSDVPPRRFCGEYYYAGHSEMPPRWIRPPRHEPPPHSWDYPAPPQRGPPAYYHEHYREMLPEHAHWREPPMPYPPPSQSRSWKYGSKPMATSIPPPRVRFSSQDMRRAPPIEERPRHCLENRPKVVTNYDAGRPCYNSSERPKKAVVKAMVTPEPSNTKPEVDFKGNRPGTTTKGMGVVVGNDGDPAGKIIISKGKWAWKDYPELEAFLIANRDEYLRHSAMNYTSQQKEFNNRLTERLVEVADRHNYVFDRGDFNFVSIRDRIRCYYKSYVQSNKKRGIIVSYPPAPRKKQAGPGTWAVTPSVANTE